MATAGRAYVVRGAGAGTGPGEVYQVYPDTLKGLIQALEDALPELPGCRRCSPW